MLCLLLMMMMMMMMLLLLLYICYMNSTLSFAPPPFLSVTPSLFFASATAPHA